MTAEKDHNLPNCPVDDDPLAQEIWHDPALLAAMDSFEQNEVRINKVPDNQPVDFNIDKQFPNEHQGKFSHMVIENKWPLSLAASLVIAVVISLFLPNRSVDTFVQTTKKAVTSHQTKAGKLADVTLSDGSMLNLNANTRLQVVMADNKRRVLFQQGEAFFKVESDKEKPFFVETFAGQVEVVGTAFNVDQTQQGVEVKVYEGQVKVHGKDGLHYTLLPGDSVLMQKSGVIKLADFSPNKVEGWQHGTLTFTHKPMNYVIEKLNRYLEQPVYLDPALNHKEITGTFMLNNVEDTLILLSQLYQLELLEQQGSRYLVAKISS